MLKKLDLITFIQHDKLGESFTIYLIQKKDKVILPLDINLPYVGMLDPKENNKFEFVNPGLYNTLHRIFIGLEIRIKNVIIYKHSGNNFYCYLEIFKNGDSLKINVSPLDGIIFAKIANSPILIKQEILDIAGIKITKKIIRDALFEN